MAWVFCTPRFYPGRKKKKKEKRKEDINIIKTHLILSTKLHQFWKLSIELKFKATSSKLGLTIMG